jgi:hypothetical protein
VTAISAASRIPRVRWGIGVLLGPECWFNYFDRINLSVGGPQLQQDFGLTDSELGWLFSGLFWPRLPLGLNGGQTAAALLPGFPAFVRMTSSSVNSLRILASLLDSHFHFWPATGEGR